MEYRKYIEGKKEIYLRFLYFFDDESEINDSFKDLSAFIQIHKYLEKKEEFKAILYILNEFSKNTHRSTKLITKIELFFSQYEEYITQNFTQTQLFQIFRKNPRILYILFDKNIITIDDSIIELIHKQKQDYFLLRRYQGEKVPNVTNEMQKYRNKNSIIQNYKYYFYMFIKSKLQDEERSKIEKELLDMNENIFEGFEKKCQIGENDSYICKLIQHDLIDEFIIYTNKINLKLTSEITPSIFETNSLLYSKPASLIEYSAFFGSIQIFQYLRMNQIDLTASLWLYAIHGKNPEIIHILEECNVEPEDDTYMECLKESIKCHHNDIARYIQNKFMDEFIEINESNFQNNPISFGFHYYNYEFIEIYQNLQFPFYYACLYDHFPIVKLLIKEEQVDLNKSIVLSLHIYKTTLYILK